MKKAVSDPKNLSLGPYGETRLAAFLRKRVEELASRYSQREIAAKAGYNNANIISMMKAGTFKVPLSRVTSLARALEVDEIILLRLVLEQELPEDSHVAMLLSSATITSNERLWLDAIRVASRQTDPEMTDERRAAIDAIFAPRKPE